jgi:hypothetical protein
MQEFTCYYDYSFNSEDFELDECFLTDNPSETLGYQGGKEVYQPKNDVVQLKSFEAQTNVDIDVQWF